MRSTRGSALQSLSPLSLTWEVIVPFGAMRDASGLGCSRKNHLLICKGTVADGVHCADTQCVSARELVITERDEIDEYAMHRHIRHVSSLDSTRTSSKSLGESESPTLSGDR